MSAIHTKFLHPFNWIWWVWNKAPRYFQYQFISPPCGELLWKSFVRFSSLVFPTVEENVSKTFLLFSSEKLLEKSSSTTSTIVASTTEMEQEEQLGYKNVVMNFYSTPTRSSPCRYIDGSKRQNHQCRRDSGLPEALLYAKKLAMSHCQEQFKFDRWNCSIELKGKRNIFKKVVKKSISYRKSPINEMFVTGLQRNCLCSCSYCSSAYLSGMIHCIIYTMN